MIEVAHLAKSFPARGRRGQRIAAVRDVSFRAPDGAITALLGPNGAGKTTVLRILCAMVRADAGTVRVGGLDPQHDPLGVRASLGVLSDARGLYTRLSARDNIRYYGELRGMKRIHIDARIDELAAVLEFSELLERRTEGFSTGEKMKVSLARALIHDPAHVILDEPTNGLDVMSTRALRRMLQRLRDAGKCIVLSSHVMQEIDLLADRIHVIAHGHTIAEGSVADLLALTQTARLEDAFVHLVTPAALQGATP